MKTSATPQAKSTHRREKGRGTHWQDYLPLLVIIVAAKLSASALQAAAYLEGGSGAPSLMLWMHDFMGIFLVIFSLFKFFDLSGFADGFQMYDLLAMRWRGYAFIYPFIELGLGLGYLSRWQPMAIYSATVVVMLFGAAGVLMALKKGLDINCACMGNVLKVPLSTVALTEDIGMALMAAGMVFLKM